MHFRFLLCLIIIAGPATAQHKLHPGFNAKEYISLFSLSKSGHSIPDAAERSKSKDPYTLVYQSPEVGLKNQWSYFLRSDSVGVIAIRGTVSDKISWLANFYAAMIPATGVLQLNDSTVFPYQFAADSKAAVHVGWAVATAFMAPDMVARLQQQYTQGVKETYIFGHSQGGAIAYMVRSYLHYLQQQGKLPADMVFKTYCSAAPKPGNMYYAYDFEFINKGGWSFTIVNAADWVPESPYTVQKIQDMNPVNPLVFTKEGLKKQSWLVRLLGSYYYGKFNRRPRKVQQLYTRFFGNTLYKMAIVKALAQYKKPEYYPSANYMRAGTPIVLMPDEGYYKQFFFDDKKKDYFVHHHFNAYYYLLKKDYY